MESVSYMYPSHAIIIASTRSCSCHVCHARFIVLTPSYKENANSPQSFPLRSI